ncbi:MAG: hypothetical protein P8Z31_12435 [Gammaproteobacteria bacterium]
MHRFLQPLLLLLFLPFLQQVYAAEKVSILNAEKELAQAAETIESWDRETTLLEETEQLRSRLFELQSQATKQLNSRRNARHSRERANN